MRRVVDQIVASARGRGPGGPIRHPSGLVLSYSMDSSGRRLWTCSVCGHEGLWTDEWSSYGGVEWTIAVVCNDTCRAKWGERK